MKFPRFLKLAFCVRSRTRNGVVLPQTLSQGRAWPLSSYEQSQLVQIPGAAAAYAQSHGRYGFWWNSVCCARNDARYDESDEYESC